MPTSPGEHRRRAHPASSFRERWPAALGLLVGAGVAVLLLGLFDWGVRLSALTATIGPTVYVFLAHPRSESAKLRNAAIGHGVALSVGVLMLLAFGLWAARGPVERGHVTLAQAFAAAVGVGLTLLLLELAGSHHAPAASTVLLVTTGLARPGRPLVGLVVGLALVLLASPLLVRILPGPAGRPARRADPDR